METNSLFPLNHFKVARGLPEIEVQVILLRLPAVRTSSTSRPWICGGPGGSVRRWRKPKILIIKKIINIEWVYISREKKKPQYQEILLLFRVEMGLKKTFLCQCPSKPWWAIEAKALWMAEGNVVYVN